MTTTPARDWREQYAATLREFRTFDEHVDAVMAIDQAHAAEVRAAALTDHERRFLAFALGLAADHVFSEDGFTDDDEAALESLRRLAAWPPARPDNTTGA